MLRTIYSISPNFLKRFWEKLWFRFVKLKSSEGILYAGRNDLLLVEIFEAAIVDKISGSRNLYFIDHAIPWEGRLFQRPQHMAMAMARLGYFVIYQSGEFDGKCMQVADGVWVSPRFPANYPPNRCVRVRYSTSPTVQPHDARNVSVFEYIDHISPQISGSWTKQLHKNLNRLIQKSDVVVATSAKLRDEVEIRKQPSSINALIRNGVNPGDFQNPDSIEDTDPVMDNVRWIESKKKKFRIVCGYYGAIAPWLWFDEIEKIVRSNPDILFIWIGPDYNNSLKNLTLGPNSHHIGAVEYEKLPHLSATFDVAIIPFEPGEVARTTSPLKLFEYFASGLPVLATKEMIECSPYVGCFSFEGSGDFKKLVTEAFSQREKIKSTLIKNAHENSWEKRAQQLKEILDDVMGVE